MQADDDQGFREEVRAWLQANLPADMVARSQHSVHPSREDMLGVSALLARRGWSVPSWPVAHGGTGWSGARCQIFDEELVLAGAPPNNIQGVSLVGPVLCEFGTAQQQAQHLPGIREGRVFWSQGFSEPNAGSDLASLRTRAWREGDHYRVEGQKIWTSQAMMADWLFCLVRTDPTARPQRGISFLLIPMRSPGITVRPIASIDEGESLCEVFFDAVRVPLANLVGEEGRGWDYAKYLLGKERVQTAEVPRNRFYLARLKALAEMPDPGGRIAAQDPVFRDRIAAAEIDLLSLRAGVTAAIDSGDVSALTPSALKIVGCELMQRLLGLQVEALGAWGAVFHPHQETALTKAPGPALARGVSAEFLFRRAATIYGGSSEIQKNIIAKLVFAGGEGSRLPLNEENAMLRESASRFARGEYPLASRSSFSARTPEDAQTRWRSFAAQGYGALALAERAGGSGAGVDALAVVSEAFGAALMPEPYLMQALLPGLLLSWIGSAAADDLATALVQGDRRIALLDPGMTTIPAAGDSSDVPTDDSSDVLSIPPSRSPGLHLRQGAQGAVLQGSAAAIDGLAHAEVLLAVARRPDGSLALCQLPARHPALHWVAGRSIDGRSIADLRIEALPLPAEACLTPDSDATALIEKLRDHALVLRCADAVGAMGEAFRITRDYLGIRRQFGTTLSEFQALRHRMAEMLAELTIARAMLAASVSMLHAAPAQRAPQAAACKARIGRAAMMIANAAVQLHGGIGMTEANLIGQYYKRLFCFEILQGNSADHTRRFAELGR